MLEEQKFEFCEERDLSEHLPKPKKNRQPTEALPLFGASRKIQQEPPEENLGKMIYCTFSGIKEQTPADEHASCQPSALKQRRKQTQTKDMRCFYKDSHLTVVTRGGLKYVNNLRLKIDEVFPMEDGLLIRALFNSDLISFELGANPPIFQKMQQTNKSQGINTTADRTYVYLSLLEHPLNEAYPVNLVPFQPQNSSKAADQQHINTQQFVFWVSPTLPLCLIHDPEKFTTRFCLICRYTKRSQNLHAGADNSLDSLNNSGLGGNLLFGGHGGGPSNKIMGMSFNSSQQNAQQNVSMGGGGQGGFGQLPQIFGQSQVSILTQFETEIQTAYPPDKVHVCRGLTNSHELTISLFISQTKQVHVYEAMLNSSDSELQFERKALFENVESMETLEYNGQVHASEQTRNCVKLVSRSLFKRLVSPGKNENPNVMQQSHSSQSKELSYFTKRLNQLKADTIMLNLQEGVLKICTGGYVQIRQIDISKLLTQQLQIVGNRLVGISDARNSNLQLHLADGTQRRVTLKCSLTDFTVRSILKILKRVLPQQEYTLLHKDVINLFTAQSAAAKTSHVPNQFEKFGNFLVTLLCGKDSNLLSRQSAELAKIVQSSHVMQAVPESKWQSQHVKTIQGQRKSGTLGAAGGTDTTTRKRLSVAQNTGGGPSMATGGPKKSGTKLVKRQSQVDTIAGTVPNAFNLMLQSDFSVDFMGANPLMFSSELTEKAMTPTPARSSSKTSVEEATSLKKTTSQQQPASTTNKKTPIKNSSITQSPLKRQVKSGAKGKSTETQQQQLAKKKETTTQITTTAVKPSYLLKSEDVQPFAEKIFHVLHLLYEDLKLDRMRFPVEGRKVRRLLLAWLMEEAYCPQKTTYVAYYLADADKDDPQIRALFKDELKKHATQVANMTADVDLEQVPKIHTWMEQLLTQESAAAIPDFPICFEQTRTICRLYQVLFHKEVSYFLPLSEEPGQQIDDSLMEGGDPAIRLILFNKQSALFAALNRTDISTLAQDYLMLKRQSSYSDLHIFEKVLYTMKDEQLGIDELTSWPALVSLPFFEVIRYTRLHLQDIQTVPWPVSLYKLIHREDIINNLMQTDPTTPQLAPGIKAHKSQIQTQGRQMLRQQSAEIKRASFQRKRMSKEYALNRHESNVFSVGEAEQMGFAAQLIDDELQQTKMQNAIVQELIGGGEDMEQQDKQPIGITGKASATASNSLTISTQMSDFLRNKFGKDTRYKEVEHMLSSSQKMSIKIEGLLNSNQAEQQSVNETERQRQIKAHLEKVFRRHLSKCVGRGALTLGTQETIPTETLEIPKINQTGQIANLSQNELDEAHVGSSVINMELSREEREQLQWPSFHNGAASALRIAQSCFKRGGSGGSKVHGQQNTAAQNQSGLNQTRNWIMYHKPQEPRNEHGGFLLGIGLLGQLDSLQAPDLYQHLKSAHDSTTIGILLGRAASQIGKKDDSDTRMMCLHIPALLPQNLLVDISLPVQSAAVVSAGILYQGTQNRLISEMLIAQIARKPTSDKMIEREGYALASGIALGLVNLASSRANKLGSKIMSESENLPSILGIQMPAQNAQIQDLQLDERLIRFIEGGKAMALPRSMLSNAQQQEGSKSSAIKENDMVNVYVTGSAGIMALALTHLKSNNQDIANRLVMPQTFYDMEFVMPHILLQKVLCKNLILWDAIQCSHEWLNAQIPPLVREIFEADYEQVQKKYSARVKSDEIDFATVALCFVNIIAGATFSIGFKYAGTGSPDAKRLIIDQIEFFRKRLKVVPGTQPSGGPILTNTTHETKNQVDKATVDTCLCVLAFALALVMAGTCDIEAFRQLRVLRKRLEGGDMHYGYNMAINMAIGFLFLGSGAYTFSRSEPAIAALLISTYPILPSSAADNRFHLQALRHFYVMAIETRLLQARDIDTGKFVNVEVSVKVRDESTGQVSTIRQQTPNIINGQILQIEVRGNPEYHDVCQQVVYEGFMGSDEDVKMDIDFMANGGKQGSASGTNDGRFEQSALQQVIYVKRKTYQDNESKEEASQQGSVTSIAHLMTTGEISEADLQKRASQALEKLLTVKDPSIQSFIKAFVGDFESQKEEWQLPADLFDKFDQSMALQISLCRSTTLVKSDKDIAASYKQKKRVKRAVKSALEAELEKKTIQRQMLTLIALEECYVQDKVAALPLFLRLFDGQVEGAFASGSNASSFVAGGRKSSCSLGDSLELLGAYGTFMRNAAQTQFAFIKVSPQILPQELSNLQTASRQPITFSADLVDYVNSGASTFLTTDASSPNHELLSSLADKLDASKLQLCKLTLLRANEQLAQLPGLELNQKMAMMRSIMKECLAPAIDFFDQSALDAIIKATLTITE